MVNLGRPRRPSYRLGRRLKSSAKARLDYITYLQSGGSNRNKGPHYEPGQLSRMRFDLGGLIRANIAPVVKARAIMEMGGSVLARLVIQRRVAGTMAYGGNVTIKPVVFQFLKAAIEGGYDMRTAVYPPHRLSGTIEYGGALKARALITHNLKPKFDLGGAMRTEVEAVKVKLAANIAYGGNLEAEVVKLWKLKGAVDAGGLLKGNVNISKPPVNLRAVISGGGAMNTKLKDAIKLRAVVDAGGAMRTRMRTGIMPEAQAVIDAMSPAPSNERKLKINGLVGTLIDNGIWAKLDALYMLYAHSEASARINWLNPAGPKAVNFGGGAPTFVPDGYYASDANNSWCWSSQLTLAQATKLTPTEGALYLYSNAEPPAGSSSQPNMIGVFSSNASFRGYWGRQTAASPLRVDDRVRAATVASMPAGSLPALAMYSGESTQLRIWLNGQSIVSVPSSSAGGRDNSIPICIGGVATSDTTASVGPRPLQMAAWGANLTAGEQVVLRAAISEYAPPPAGFQYSNPEAKTIVEAMTVEPDDIRKAKIDTLVGTLKTQGIWSRLSNLYMLHAHDRQAARINWKNPAAFTLTENGTVNFTANVGASMANDTSCYDSGFVPATHGGAGIFATTDMSMFVRAVDNGVGNNPDIGCDNTWMAVNLAASNGFKAQMQNNAVYQKTANAAAGLRAFVKTAAATVANANFLFEGTVRSNQLANGSDSAASTVQIAVGAQRVTSRPFGSSRVLKTAGWGISLTQAQLEAMDNAFTTFYS